MLYLVAGAIGIVATTVEQCSQVGRRSMGIVLVLPADRSHIRLTLPVSAGYGGHLHIEKIKALVDTLG